MTVYFDLSMTVYFDLSVQVQNGARVNTHTSMGTIKTNYAQQCICGTRTVHRVDLVVFQVRGGVVWVFHFETVGRRTVQAHTRNEPMDIHRYTVHL